MRDRRIPFAGRARSSARPGRRIAVGRGGRPPFRHRAIERQRGGEEALRGHFGIVPLNDDEVGLRTAGWTAETPLWYYILREAAVLGSGDQLGPAGGGTVAGGRRTLVGRG